MIFVLVVMERIIWGIGVYLAVGVMFAVAFAAAGVGRVSPAARGSGWGFRLLIIPGTAIFWPLLAARWARPAIEPEALPPPVEPADEWVDPEKETAA